MANNGERKEGKTKREWELMVLETEAELLRRKNQRERLNLEKEQLKDELIALQRLSRTLTNEFIDPRAMIINRKLTDGQNTMNRLSLEIMVFQKINFRQNLRGLFIEWR